MLHRHSMTQMHFSRNIFQITPWSTEIFLEDLINGSGRCIYKGVPTRGTHYTLQAAPRHSRSVSPNNWKLAFPSLNLAFLESHLQLFSHHHRKCILRLPTRRILCALQAASNHQRSLSLSEYPNSWLFPHQVKHFEIPSTAAHNNYRRSIQKSPVRRTRYTPQTTNFPRLPPLSGSHSSDFYHTCFEIFELLLDNSHKLCHIKTADSKDILL